MPESRIVEIQSKTDCCIESNGTTLANKHAAREARAVAPREGHGLGVHFRNEAGVAVGLRGKRRGGQPRGAHAARTLCAPPPPE